MNKQLFDIRDPFRDLFFAERQLAFEWNHFLAANSIKRRLRNKWLFEQIKSKIDGEFAKKYNIIKYSDVIRKIDVKTTYDHTYVIIYSHVPGIIKNTIFIKSVSTVLNQLVKAPVRIEIKETK